MNPLLIVLALLTAPVSVPLTVPVNPPPPVPLTSQVSQQVTLNGQAYLVTGTLTFTPVQTTSEALVEFPSGSGLLFREGHIPGWGYGNTSQWSTPELAIANRPPLSWLLGEDFR